MKKPLNKEELVTKSKHFCMLPWVHMHILPSSSVIPCCVWPYNQPVGNVKENSLTDIWNNEAYVEVRNKMLNDEFVPNCNQCYERDRANGLSLRSSSNKDYAHLFDKIVVPTADDGKLKEFNMALYDVRFSNICNFKCRGCSPELSSAWQTDHEALFDYKSDKEKLISVMPNDKLWEDLVKLLPTVERAYFAGGEPLIMDEHYLILEELLKIKKFDVRLDYNSNMSNLKFRNKLVMDYWKKFPVVTVGVSIDDFEARGEYFRHGMKWEKVVENILAVKKECPHVVFSINCTVSLFNVNFLPELHQKAYELGLIKLGDFFANLLVDPDEYRVQVLPREFREKVVKKLSDYMKKIYAEHSRVDPHGVEKLANAFNSVIKFLLEGEEKSNLDKFLKLNSKLDKIRGENFATTYPELAFLEELNSKKA